MADNEGTLRVYQLVNESAHLINTLRLPRSKEIKAEQALGIDRNTDSTRVGVEEQFLQDLIKQIYISKNEKIALITFQSGLVSAYNTKKNFSYIGDAYHSELA